jgi:hypothetical protein
MMMKDEDVEVLVARDEEGTVCPSCAAFIGVNEVFCPQCHAPISLLSGTDPLQSIRAEAFVYSKVVDSRPKRVVLIGVWALGVPWALIGGLYSYTMLEEGMGSGMAGFIYFWIGIAMTLIPIVLIFKVTRNYIKLPPRKFEDLD